MYYLTPTSLVTLTWLLRIVSLALFTVEGHVYLSKVGVAREVVKKKFISLFTGSSENVPGAWVGADDEVTLELETTSTA